MTKAKVRVTFTSDDVKELFDLYGLSISDNEAEHILDALSDQLKNTLREEGEDIIAYATSAYRRGEFTSKTKETD